MKLDFAALAAALDRAHIAYQSAGTHSFVTWIRPVIDWTKKHGGQLVAAIFKKALTD